MSKAYQNNAVLGPSNAWIFNFLSGYMDVLFGDSKKKLFQNHPDTVVEIGCGAGANMRYLRPVTRLIAIGLNKHMHANLKKSDARYGIQLEIKSITGEAAGFSRLEIESYNLYSPFPPIIPQIRGEATK